MSCKNAKDNKCNLSRRLCIHCAGYEESEVAIIQSETEGSNYKAKVSEEIREPVVIEKNKRH